MSVEKRLSSNGSVVLEHVSDGDRLQPGLAIAWAHRHLDVLAELELDAQLSLRADQFVSLPTGNLHADEGADDADV